MTKRAYRFQEFLETYGIGKDAAYAAIRRGDLIAHKRGKVTIVLADDAEAYVASLPRLELPAADDPEPPEKDLKAAGPGDTAGRGKAKRRLTPGAEQEARTA